MSNYGFWIGIILIIVFAIPVIILLSKQKTKESYNFGGERRTSGNYPLYYKAKEQDLVPHDWVYPFEFLHSDGTYAYFIDQIGDEWRCNMPCKGPQYLERAVEGYRSPVVDV